GSKIKAARSRLTAQKPIFANRRLNAGNSRCRRGRQNSQAATTSKLPKTTIKVIRSPSSIALLLERTRNVSRWDNRCREVGHPVRPDRIKHRHGPFKDSLYRKAGTEREGGRLQRYGRRARYAFGTHGRSGGGDADGRPQRRRGKAEDVGRESSRKTGDLV